MMELYYIFIKYRKTNYIILNNASLLAKTIISIMNEIFSS